MKARPGQFVHLGLILSVLICIAALLTTRVFAAPYAAMVMDARTGEVLHSRNADTRLHPASLTKMMTLYVVFEAVENGEISLDTEVTISRNAASEPPSKIGLRAGQKIQLRYLIRAAAIKSANDAATALGEAISGSEAAFARRMNRTAKALGMSRSTFKNANGLTETGHLSTARDMTNLGRRLFYHYPEYYNLFSRRTADAGVAQVRNTNRRLLSSYQGADGIKTGYTRAAGFNLVASAERGSTRIIATVFGGRSSATRNARVAELLDMGFQRAPRRAAVRMPNRPGYSGNGETRVAQSVTRSPRPLARPSQSFAALNTPSDEVLVAMEDGILQALEEAQTSNTNTENSAQSSSQSEDTLDSAIELAVNAVENAPETQFQSETVVQIVPERIAQPADPIVVTRISTSGGRHWGVNIGRFNTRYQAERVLLRTALQETATLDGTLRRIVPRGGAFDANFMGLSQESAELACRRLRARQIECNPIGPS